MIIHDPNYTRIVVENTLIRMEATPTMIWIIQRIADISGWGYALRTVKSWEESGA